MRRFLESLTPSQRRYLVAAVAAIGIASGFYTISNDPSATVASEDTHTRTEASTSTVKTMKESFEVRVGDSKSADSSTNQVTIFRSVITED